MRELRISEQHGQITVTTSDGRKAVSTTVQGALEKLFGPRAWASMGIVFTQIKPSPDPNRIREGTVGA